METFRNRYPQVDLRFADGEPQESVARLKQRELDVALLFDPVLRRAGADPGGRALRDDRDLEYVELFEDPFHVVLPRAHPLAADQRLELRDLAGQRVVTSPPECSHWVTDLRACCIQAHVEPEFETCYRTADFAALQAIVATGRGITLVPELALDTTKPAVVAVPLRGGPVRRVRLATLAAVTQSPACQAMVSVVEELIAHRRGSHATVLTVAGR